MTDKENSLVRTMNRSSSGGKRYCVLCKRHQNEVMEDGFKVTLHRIPGGQCTGEKARRKLWLRGLKMFRPNLPVSDNTRVCILHFEDRQYIHGKSVPKNFNLEKEVQSCKARRPLLNRDQNTKQFLAHSDDDSDIFYAVPLNETVSVDQEHLCDITDMFVDNLETCATVEIGSFKSNTKPTYCYSTVTVTVAQMDLKMNTITVFQISDQQRLMPIHKQLGH